MPKNISNEAELAKADRMGFIEGIDCIAGDLEDGAYFAIMAENGITLDELVDFAEYEKAQQREEKEDELREVFHTEYLQRPYKEVNDDKRRDEEVDR